MKPMVLKFRYLPISSGNFCQITSNRKHSKSSCPQGHVGSNPTVSAKKDLRAHVRFQVFFFFAVFLGAAGQVLSRSSSCMVKLRCWGLLR